MDRCSKINSLNSVSESDTGLMRASMVVGAERKGGIDNKDDFVAIPGLLERRQPWPTDIVPTERPRIEKAWL